MTWPSWCCRGSPSRPSAGPGSSRPTRSSRWCRPRGRTWSCCATRTSPSTPTPSARRRGGCCGAWRAGARRGPVAAPGRSPPRAAPARRPRRPAAHAARVAALTAASRSSATGASRSQRPRPLVLVCDVSGLDGALRADAARVHAGVRRRAPAGGGVRVRHAAHPGHRRAARPRSRRGARPRRGGGRRLVGRHADRRRRSRRSTASTAVVSAAGRSSWCSPTAGIAATRRAARAGDGAAVALRAPRGVAQPAEGGPGLRAAHARHGGRAPARRPVPRRQLARLAGAAGEPDGRRHCDEGCARGRDGPGPRAASAWRSPPSWA